MRRRDFITFVGGAVVGSATARAQQGVRRIGILMNLAADDPEGQARVAAFLQGLQKRSPLRRTSSSPLPFRLSRHYSSRHTPCRSYLQD